MPDYSKRSNRNLDEQLAALTDRILDLGAAQDSGLKTPGLNAQDSELLMLEETVRRLKRFRGAGQPDPAMAQRMRTRLVNEWRALNPPGARQPRPARRPFWQLSPGGQRQFALRVAAVAFILLLAVVVVSPVGQSILLPATAGNQPGALPVLLVIGLALLAGLAWFFLRDR